MAEAKNIKLSSSHILLILIKVVNNLNRDKILTKCEGMYHVKTL